MIVKKVNKSFYVNLIIFKFCIYLQISYLAELNFNSYKVVILKYNNIIIVSLRNTYNLFQSILREKMLL